MSRRAGAQGLGCHGQGIPFSPVQHHQSHSSVLALHHIHSLSHRFRVSSRQKGLGEGEDLAPEAPQDQARACSVPLSAAIPQTQLCPRPAAAPTRPSFCGHFEAPRSHLPGHSPRHRLRLLLTQWERRQQLLGNRAALLKCPFECSSQAVRPPEPGVPSSPALSLCRCFCGGSCH